MRRILLFAFAVGFYAPVVAQENKSKSEVATVGVCELVKNPVQYHGRIAEVRSRVYPAKIDTPTVLLDSTCAKSILLDTHRTAEASRQQEYRDFTRYLREWRTVDATVLGRFEMILVPSREPMLFFRLLRVADVIPGPAFFPQRRKPK